MEPATFTMRRGRYSEAFRKKDEENIANLYKSNGFRDVKVTSIVDRAVDGNTGQVGVTVQIEEGPQWIVDSVTLEGVEKGDREALEVGLASLAGQPFSEVNMATDRNHVLTWYYCARISARGFSRRRGTTATPRTTSTSATKSQRGTASSFAMSSRRV